jgi:putative SOS response-associated peptidase YedK
MDHRDDRFSFDALEDLDAMVEVLQQIALKDGSEVLALDEPFSETQRLSRLLEVEEAFAGVAEKATSNGKVPHAIARADGTMLAFAGLWEGWRSPDGDVLRTFAIITTDANAQMSALHSRMPVILEKADWPLWLGEADSGAEMLLRPAAEGVLRIWPVDKRVGNVRNDGPELLEPEIPPEPDSRDAVGPNPL